MRRGNGITSGRRWWRLVWVAIALVTAVATTGVSSAWAQDTTPPDTDIISGPIGLTRDNQPRFNIESNEPGSTFNCKLDALPLLACGPIFFQPSQPLAEGPHTLLAYATDPAGNTDPIGSRRDFIVDRSITGARLIGPRRQQVSPRELRVNVELRGQEALKVRVSGVVSIGKRELAMRPLERSLGDRTSIRPALTAAVSVERAVAQALARGDRVEVEVTARFRDEVGNEERRSRKIVLR